MSLNVFTLQGTKLFENPRPAGKKITAGKKHGWPEPSGNHQSPRKYFFLYLNTSGDVITQNDIT